MRELNDQELIDLIHGILTEEECLGCMESWPIADFCPICQTCTMCCECEDEEDDDEDN